MHTILVLVETVALVAGALAGAAMLCCATWYMCRLVHHPEWAAFLILCLVAVALTGALPRSGLLNLALAFALAGTLPLWLAGRDWRRRWSGPAPLTGVRS
jgi:hypothetical protein